MVVKSTTPVGFMAELNISSREIYYRNKCTFKKIKESSKA